MYTLYHSDATSSVTRFDAQRSLAMDRIILALEANPPAWRRVWLRWQKFLLERHVPPRRGRS